MFKGSGIKAAIIGTGFVGSTTAFTLMFESLISELVLIDINLHKAEGEAMDLNHGMSFLSPMKIYTGDYSACKGADIVILTAGVNQKPGESRIELLQRNSEIFRNIIKQIIMFNNDCILLVVTNPVDILTYVTLKVSGFPESKVIGSGTVLDTARFQYLLADHTGVDLRDVNAYIIGEHGDTEVAAWSLANIAGISMDDYCETCKGCKNNFNRNEIYYKVKNAAYEIIERKGATYYAVALAVSRIVKAIIRNENSVLTVSSMLNGQFGLHDVCLSLPAVVNSNGIANILNIPLKDEEITWLVKSGETLKKQIKELEF